MPMTFSVATLTIHFYKKEVIDLPLLLFVSSCKQTLLHIVCLFIVPGGLSGELV